MTALRVQLWFWQQITWLDQRKNFLFLLWVTLYMIMGIYLHDPPPFNGPFFVTPPFSESQKVVTLPVFPPPLPLANFWQVPYYVFLYCQWMDSGVTGVRGPLVVKHAIVGYRLELVYAITPLSRPEEKTVKVRHQKQSPVWIVIVQVSLYNGS